MFYQELGYLAFGSRLRRLSEGLIAEINQAYRKQDIPFDASWFPVFFLLDKAGQVSIRDISDRAGVSHSAMSQLVSVLENKGLVQSNADASDGRKKQLSFTPAGKKLLAKVKPVWTALEQAMEAISREERPLSKLLETIGQLEQVLEKQTLSERILLQLHLKNETI